jgi:hypothetical protein
MWVAASLRRLLDEMLDTGQWLDDATVRDILVDVLLVRLRALADARGRRSGG